MKIINFIKNKFKKSNIVIDDRLYLFVSFNQRELLSLGHKKSDIKNILDKSYFEILEKDGDKIISIKNLYSGEIFNKGDSFFCIKDRIHNKIISFETLTGKYVGDIYYINYVSGGSNKLYHLSSISKKMIL